MSFCCKTYSTMTHDGACLLTLTEPNGQETSINLFGASLTDIVDASNTIVGYEIKGMNMSVKVSSDSSMSKATVEGHITTCHN